MTESGKFMKEVTVEYRWEHPDNGCPMRQIQPFITKSISATGSDEAEARRYSRILAENSPQYCDGCRQEYRLK